MSQALPHPSPHRDRVRLLELLFGLFAGPAAWIAQMIAGYGLSSYACFPRDEPYLTSPPPGWGGEQAILLAINLIGLALTVAGFLVARSGWRRVREETAGGALPMLDVGEGRSRFLSICGMLASGVFAVAILFNTVTILATPACWSLAR